MIMRIFNLNISPNQGYGFCNQIYSICGTCSYAVENNINVIFVGKYLREIHTTDYCKISDIIDIKSTNLFLKKYNIILLDVFDYKFNITKIEYGFNDFCYDLTNEINNDYFISKTLNLNDIKGNPIVDFKKKYFIDIATNLYVTYSINDSFLKIKYDVFNGFLKEDIDIRLKQLVPSLKYNDGSFIFNNTLKKIVFNKEHVYKANTYFDNLKINSEEEVNVIHLRLEDDMITNHSKDNNMSFDSYKKRIENVYIKLIEIYIKNKKSKTILIAHNYDNKVIDYLKNNDYNYIMTPKMEELRDVSAIIDLHIGQNCRNVYIGVFESTFSFALFDRIRKRNNLISVIFQLNKLDKISLVNWNGLNGVDEP